MSVSVCECDTEVARAVFHPGGHRVRQQGQEVQDSIPILSGTLSGGIKELYSVCGGGGMLWSCSCSWGGDIRERGQACC